MQNFYLAAFRVFFKIGIFTLGGGYAIFVNARQWIEKQ